MKNFIIKLLTITFALSTLVNSVSAGGVKTNITFVNGAEVFLGQLYGKGLFSDLESETMKTTFVEVAEIINAEDNLNGVDVYLKLDATVIMDSEILDKIEIISDNGRGDISFYTFESTQDYQDFMLITSLEPGEKQVVTITIQLPLDYVLDDVEKIESLEWMLKTEEHSQTAAQRP